MAYCLPEHPFEIWPWSKTFADTIASAIPAIDRLTEVSTMPQVTRLFMSFQWTIAAPIFAGLLIRFNGLSVQSMIETIRITRARWWYYLFAPPTAAILAWSILTLAFLDLRSPNDPLDAVIAAMSGSRFWLGLWGSCTVLIGTFFVFLFFKSPVLVRMAFTIRTNMNNKGA
jgi:hypothetical protein